MAQTKILYALGFFDGVHRGHQAIFAEVCRLAAQHHMRPGVFTYETIPRLWWAAARLPC
jgi:FAD synthase